MKLIFQKNLQLEIFDLQIVKKIIQMKVFGYFLDFALLVFLDFAHNGEHDAYFFFFLTIR